MHTMRLIVVGGFLGAGKTTLLSRASKRLAAEGVRVGLVTNDQAEGLVDTVRLQSDGHPVQEVGGGCFCCRFDDLLAAMDRHFQETDANVVLAEAVGSCTDLAATVVEPMRRHHRGRISTAALSVVVDPFRLRSLLEERMPFAHSVEYIIQKQIDEADVIVLNKADQVTGTEIEALKHQTTIHWPGCTVMTMSALNDEGVGEWLDLVGCRAGSRPRIQDVDYDVYADGEARLGWLNAAFYLQASDEIDWSAFADRLLEQIGTRARRAGVEIAHVKAILSAAGTRLEANLTGSDRSPVLNGVLPSRSERISLILNARAEVAPDALRMMILSALADVADSKVGYDIDALQYLSPSRPEPTYRYDD